MRKSIMINEFHRFKICDYVLRLIKIEKINFCTFSNNSNDDEDEKVSPKRRKIVVYRKTFSVHPSKPSKILDWKKASQVVKRLNYENKKLFGPLLNHSQNEQYDKTKLNEFNEIVQHRTTLPIEDCADSKPAPKKSSGRSGINNSLDFDYNNILDFPLLNKSYDGEKMQIKINEINALRKHLESKTNFMVPSVSAILEKTMPKESVEALARWKRNMIEKLGEEGFQKYRAELLKNGASIHSNINSYLSATPEADILIEESNLGHWRSLKTIFPRITDIKLLEERVSHPFLCYKGIVDCFAKYRDHLVVIDWKTSKRTKGALSSTYDNPLQIAAYVGALNFDPKFQYLVRKGLIVVAYESGVPANPLFIDEEKMLKYWKEWLKRIKLYWEIVESSK
ncbi:mitochondrial genome maintenance exonuclease 1 [Parasteatoda tepidariorum]|uniref:mitochondrial genome maintenance exonuclease 1 n=1 Tax=Parasteatoda tepidariorum TaxID=114398 RepID=UPI001C71BC48|nr:mitochondrial genome maintenance exonuclease 1-like [Parasteatoda tepidariorum]